MLTTSTQWVKVESPEAMMSKYVVQQCPVNSIADEIHRNCQPGQCDKGSNNITILILHAFIK